MSNSENPKILDANVEIPDPKPKDKKAKAEDVNTELADDSNQSLDVPPTQAPITDGAAPKADFVEAPKHSNIETLESPPVKMATCKLTLSKLELRLCRLQ
ncbi:hypothetical protein WJX82_002949 [Trebouxia sp. C0006]